MPIPYVIDFTGLTMNTTVANDKLGGNVMEEVKNVNRVLDGSFVKRRGVQDQTSGTDITGTAIRVVSPQEIVSNSGGVTTQVIIAIVDNEMWFVENQIGNWTEGVYPSAGTELVVGNYDTTPYQLSWGLDSSSTATLYLTPVAGDQPIQVKAGGGTFNVVYLGTGTFTTATCTEYYLDHLFAGATLTRDTLSWTIAGDDDNWTGVGAGSFAMRIPGAASDTWAQITGLRRYRNRLYIATRTSLHVLQGRTSATFTESYIRPQNWVNGATMYAVGDFLFYTDRDGVWQFNGTQAINVSKRSMADRWGTLSGANDIDNATATWDDSCETYSVFFPTAQEMWTYYLKTGAWDITTFNTTDNVQVISPPLKWSSGVVEETFMLGCVTNAKVYRTGSSTVSDDGNAITASFKTGHIRLGEINGQPGSRFRIEGIDIETVKQDEASAVKIQVTIDGTAGTQVTLTVGDAGATADTFPTSYDSQDGNTEIDLKDANLVGKYMQMAVTDDDLNARCDIRRITIWYEVLEGKAA